MIQYIESQQNKVYKRLHGMKLKKNRDKEGAFVAEGIRFVSEIPKTWKVVLFAMSEGFSKEIEVSAFEDKGTVFILSDSLFSNVCDTENPQGILALCAKQEENRKEIWQKESPFFLLAEELNDPGNLGTIIRTADACGVDGIFLSKGSVDVYNPKVLRATMGAIFHIPIFQNCDLEEISLKMKQHQIPLYAAHLKGTQYPYGLPLQNACAFLIGNEARGLSDKATSLCNQLVKLPMVGLAESLNASIAAGVLMYEVVRQRIEK